MVDIKAYPAVRDWLLPFKPELEKRATKQEWFELQQAQLSYQAKFATPKIVFRDIANETPFAIDHEAYFIDCTLFMAPNADEFLLAFLNSKMAWFQWVGETPIASGGYIRLKQQYLIPTRGLADSLGLPKSSRVRIDGGEGEIRHATGAYTSRRL